MILSSKCCCRVLAEMPVVRGQSGKTEICDVCVSYGAVFVVEHRSKRRNR